MYEARYQMYLFKSYFRSFVFGPQSWKNQLLSSSRPRPTPTPIEHAAVTTASAFERCPKSIQEKPQMAKMVPRYACPKDMSASDRRCVRGLTMERVCPDLVFFRCTTSPPISPRVPTAAGSAIACRISVSTFAWAHDTRTRTESRVAWCWAVCHHCTTWTRRGMPTGR